LITLTFIVYRNCELTILSIVVRIILHVNMLFKLVPVLKGICYLKVHRSIVSDCGKAILQAKSFRAKVYRFINSGGLEEDF